MGWLLTLWLGLPLVESDVEVQMWFSRESYCRFAHEKFTEKPMMHTLADGRRAEARVKRWQCRKLRDDEARLVPRHMRK